MERDEERMKESVRTRRLQEVARKGFLGAWLSRKNGDPTPEEMALARAESLMPLLQDVLMEQKKLLKKLKNFCTWRLVLKGCLIVTLLLKPQQKGKM